MVIINTVNNTQHNNNASKNTNSNPFQHLPNWNQQLLHLIQEIIQQIPPRQLNRELRSFFMIHIAQYKTTPPNFQDRVLQLAAILELLDEVEDNKQE